MSVALNSDHMYNIQIEIWPSCGLAVNCYTYLKSILQLFAKTSRELADVSYNKQREKQQQNNTRAQIYMCIIQFIHPWDSKTTTIGDCDSQQHPPQGEGGYFIVDLGGGAVLQQIQGGLDISEIQHGYQTYSEHFFASLNIIEN